MTLPLLLAALLACSQAPVTVGISVDEPDDEPEFLPPEFLEAIDSAGGCGDVWLQLWDADGELGLEVWRDGVLQRAAEAGEPTTETLEIGVDDVDVVIELATPVAINYCTDAVSERYVLDTWVATEGTVVFNTTPPLEEGQAYPVSLDLWNVRLYREADDAEAFFTHVSAEGIEVTPEWGG